MLKKKHLQSRQFTLIEILMAMSIFLILSLIMMRFFTSSQRIFNLTSQRNMLYADARIAMDLIARDLQGAMYNNDTTTDQGVYPFWFQKIKDTSATAPSSGLPYYNPAITWTALNFISSTTLKTYGANSNVCELRYTAVPAGETFRNPDIAGQPDIIPEGWLIRSCTADNAGVRYNFSSCPRSTAAANRLNKIWVNTAGTAENPAAAPASPSYSNFEKVIPNVYELKLYCYRYDNSSGSYALASFTPLATSDIEGTYFPVVVKIELSLLSDTDWFQWKNALKEGNNLLAVRILRHKLRTFSKAVYIPVRATY